MAPPNFFALARMLRRQIARKSGRFRASRRWELLNYTLSLAKRMEPALILSLRDAQIAAWLAKAVQTAKLVPIRHDRPPPSIGSAAGTGSGFTPSVRFPQIEIAAQWLSDRIAFTPDEFARLERDTQGVAFTVARAVTTGAVEKIRDALAKDVAEGGTRDEFREVVEDTLGQGVLSAPMIEAIYRTQTARATAAGQQTILDSPIVADEFPFVLYTAVHDSRVDPEHLMMERLGINGTAVYYADDPVIRKFWPPWRWNCRCHLVPLSVADAAKHGVREAAEWLRTGQPPLVRTYVPPPPFDLPKGWIPSGRLAAV